jgi:hypothetical protein
VLFRSGLRVGAIETGLATGLDGSGFG